ncbi:hypothetical protein BDV09DRAFT_172281 [Aspergillus tetrazonus]
MWNSCMSVATRSSAAKRDISRLSVHSRVSCRPTLLQSYMLVMVVYGCRVMTAQGVAPLFVCQRLFLLALESARLRSLVFVSPAADRSPDLTC